MNPAAGSGPGADPAQQVGRLVASALEAGEPTGWFEPLYAAAQQGAAIIPWDRGAPHWLLVEWAEQRPLAGSGRRALVVGCGLGADAEYIAGRGFGTTAFDISPSAVRAARQRYPGSAVDYRVADLLAAPPGWRKAFDLVVESQTIQSLPQSLRQRAIPAIADMVAPGGTLVVIALARDEEDDPGEWPPWPITRREIDAFGAPGLVPVQVADVGDVGRPPAGRRWVAEFRRAQPPRQRGHSPNSSTV